MSTGNFPEGLLPGVVAGTTVAGIVGVFYEAMAMSGYNIKELQRTPRHVGCFVGISGRASPHRVVQPISPPRLSQPRVFRAYFWGTPPNFAEFDLFRTRI